MNELALFAGAGGGLLGSRLLGWRTICYVEKDPYCIDVLKARIKDGFLDDAPIWDDVKTFNGKPWSGLVDIVSAGFPCQPFSVAGKRKGEADERNMWPDTIRVIREVRPRFALLENVPRLLAHGYIRRIFGDLAESGYDCRWDVIGASDVGANHRRKRLWIFAYSNGARGRIQSVAGKEFQDTTHIDHDGKKKYVANTKGDGREQRRAKCEGQVRQPAPIGSSWWSSEPDVCRVAHGIPSRVDRLKALGNGQVPAVVKTVWELMGGKE